MTVKYDLRFVRSLSLSIALATLFAQPSLAQTVDSIDGLPTDRQFFSFSADPNLPSMIDTMIGISITPDVDQVSAVFGNLPGISPSDGPDPGNNQGFISNNSTALAITFNLSESVAGVGVSFVHFVSPAITASQDLDAPAELRAFSGQNGAGTLLGTVQSSGLAAGSIATRDFVGLTFADNTIQSFVISGTGATSSVGVDGIAIAQVEGVVNVPEPGAGLVLSATVLLFLRRRRC